MTDYPFDTIIALDRVTGRPIPNGDGVIYDIADEGKTTPLQAYTLDGLPTTLQTTRDAYIPPFKVKDHWHILFVSGPSEMPMTSHLGLKEEAVEAAAAAVESANSASTAATEAAAAAQADLEARIAAGQFEGPQGKSAYQIAVDAGFVGTEAEWRASLKGLPGVNAVPADEAVGTYATTPGTATHTALKDTIASEGIEHFQPRALARLAPMLQPRTIPAVAPLNLTYSPDASPIIASSVTWGVLDGPVDLLSCVPMLTAAGELDGGYLRNTAGRTDSDANRAVYGLEWVADGNTELRFRAFYAAVKFRLYVDDVPAQTDIQTPTGVTLAGGTNFRVGVTHPNPGTTRRFRLVVAGGGLRAIYTAPTTSIYAPKVRRPKVAIIGTSFSDNSGSVALLLDSWVWSFAERFGVEVLNCSRSGSGYAVDGGGGNHAAQVPVAVAWKPDLTICEGSGNDVSASGTDIQTAAAAVFASLEATGTPVVAIGMLPRGATGEIAGTAARVVTYTKAAADAAPNVLAYLDTIGTVDPLPAYTTGAAYAAGNKVSYLGTTWEARVAIASAPAAFDRSKWKTLSWNFGTGHAGTPTGDGNRDVTVQSDGLHPTAAGAGMIAANVGPRIAGVLSAAVSTAA